MATPRHNERMQKLLNLHKILIESIAATEKDINQCSLEWLQLCDLSKKSDNSKDNVEDNQRTEAASVSIATVEDTSIINTQEIDLNLPLLKVMKVAEEEFDSD